MTASTLMSPGAFGRENIGHGTLAKLNTIGATLGLEEEEVRSWCHLSSYESHGSMDVFWDEGRRGLPRWVLGVWWV